MNDLVHFKDNTIRREIIDYYTIYKLIAKLIINRRDIISAIHVPMFRADFDGGDTFRFDAGNIRRLVYGLCSLSCVWRLRTLRTWCSFTINKIGRGLGLWFYEAANNIWCIVIIITIIINRMKSPRDASEYAENDLVMSIKYLKHSDEFLMVTEISMTTLLRQSLALVRRLGIVYTFYTFFVYYFNHLSHSTSKCFKKLVISHIH